MAGSIPPLVSSSPPPLCAFDDDDEEEDDEFGMYTAAEEIDYNECISFKEKNGGKQSGCKSRGEQDSTSQDSATDSGLCPDSEGMSPIPHSDDERTAKPPDLPVPPASEKTNCDSEHSESVETTSVTLESDNCTNLPNGHVTTESPCTITNFDDDFGHFENFEITPTLHPIDQNTVSNEQSESNQRPQENDNVVHTTEIDPEQTNGLPEHQDLSDQIVVELSGSDKILSEEEILVLDQNNDLSSISSALKQQMLDEVQQALEEDFETIQEDISTESEQHRQESANPTELVNDDEFDDFTDFKANFSSSLDLPETEQSDKFSEHSKQFSEPEHSEEEAAKSSQPPQPEESDDEFSNFADFSSSDCAFVSAQSSNSLENVSHIPFKPSDGNDLRTECEFQDWVSVFSCDDSEPAASSGAALLTQDDVVWKRLYPLETSPALSYQWTESMANRRLLSALNIDSRNILFMPWSNSAVPRFAANLSCGPLEPVKATELLQPVPAPTIPCSTQESVPDAHFDWVSSGLTNPLDCPKPVLNLPKMLSVDAENILSSLPDLSFMRKTYIDFPISERQ